MKTRQLPSAFLLLFPLWPSTIAAQVLGPNPIIAGLPVSCGGVPALVRVVDDVAVSVSGAIILNPAFFRLPGKLQLFVYAHECAHQILGANEAKADCWAIQTGRDQGWFRQSDIGYLIQLFGDSPGDWTHAPGQERIAKLMACFRGSDDPPPPEDRNGGIHRGSSDDSDTDSEPGGEAPRRKTGTLAEGGSVRVTYELRRGVSYTFQGSCDEDCDDLDLVLRRGSEEVDRDDAPDDTPVVSVTPERTATYTLEVIMPSCNTDRCRYTIEVKKD
jgi:hypothetical protein